MRSAPLTFVRKSDASRWLVLKEAEIKRGDWLDPDLSAILFCDYSADWLRDRVLKIRTQELYEGLLRNHLLPTFGTISLGSIDEAAVRRWRKERLEAGRHASRKFGPVTVTKAYRLLHAIFVTAVGDRLVGRNPCRIDGAGKEESPERQIISVPAVFAVADALPARYRAIVLLATFAGMRWGELVALRRQNLDLVLCQIRIVETTAELDRGEILPESPKSRAGRRMVSFPEDLVPELRWHLERFAQPGDRGLVFVGPWAPRSGARTSGQPGTRHASRLDCRACISTTCGTLEEPLPKPAELHLMHRGTGFGGSRDRCALRVLACRRRARGGGRAW